MPNIVCKIYKGGEELKWIEEHHVEILRQLRRFNSDNDIIYIANSDVMSDIIKIHYVEKDSGDTVARKFVEKNAELKHYFDTVPYRNREVNLQWHKSKYINPEVPANPILKVYNWSRTYFKQQFYPKYNRVKKYLKQHFYKEYIHDKIV